MKPEFLSPEQFAALTSIPEHRLSIKEIVALHLSPDAVLDAVLAGQFHGTPRYEQALLSCWSWEQIRDRRFTQVVTRLADAADRLAAAADRLAPKGESPTPFGDVH